MEIEKSGPITVLIQVLNHFLLVCELYMGAIIIYRLSGGRGGVGVGEFLRRDHMIFREN